MTLTEITRKSLPRRSVPARLAPVMEELELRQPKIVTKEMLTDILRRRQIQLRPLDAANRLQKLGWLLTLRTRGVWEYAPASRAGAIGSGDRFIELRAALLRKPNLHIAVAYESAAWLHNLTRRTPIKDVVAIPKDTSPPPALRKTFRITRNTGRLVPALIDSLPVWRIETLLVMMGAHTAAFKVWPTVNEWLPEATQRINEELIFEELENRPRATWVRVGYLLEVAGQSDIADRIRGKSRPTGMGPYYFGSRWKSGSYSGKWDLIDSLLAPHWRSFPL